MLNILIFAGIYYQREKRACDAKKKEELVESENHCSPNMASKRIESHRKKTLQGLSDFTEGFQEYSCYDDKILCKENHMLADICSVEIPMQELKCLSSEPESHASNLRQSKNSSGTDHLKQNVINSSNGALLLYLPTYSSPDAGSSSTSDLVTYQFQNLVRSTPSSEHCNQSTQSDIPDVHDVGTTVMEYEVDEYKNHSSPVRSRHQEQQTTRSNVSYQGGILRQQGGPATPSTSKKRVQIQEISV